MNRDQILTGDRPKIRPVEIDNIPEALRLERRWLPWNFQKRGDRWQKVPVGTSTSQASWNDFEAVVAIHRAGEADGIGFALGDGFSGVDLDNCVVDGEHSPLAHAVIETLGSYCEVSPTGTGVKLICRGTLPPGKTKNAEGTIEIYCSGRYFCITGHKISGDVVDGQAALETLRAKYIDLPSTGNSALNAMLRIKPKDTEQDGTKRLFSWACRAVEANLPDEVAIATIREAEKTHPFPIWFSDSDILARLRDAEAKTERGCARVEIMLGNDFPRVMGETISAMAKNGTYQHLNRIAQIQFDPPQCKYAAVDNGAPRLAFIPSGVMIEVLTEAADYFRFDGKSKQWLQCLPPDHLRSAVYQRGTYPGVRPINGVVSRPILLPDGQIVTAGGYNADTGLYLDVQGEWPAGMSTDEGVAKLFDIWCDFPFASESSKSACLAAQLTLLVRRIIKGNVPLHVVDGNRSRVGKGLLSDTWTMIAEGRRASRYTFTKGEELKKYLTSLAVRGSDYILFDNLQGKFGGPVIEAAMTRGSISDRILGASEVVDLPLPLTWLATGNGYTCSRDMVGRTSPIMLDTCLSNPETRGGFIYENLLSHVEANRRDLLIAGLSIVSNFIKAGAPKQDIPNFGGFEHWSNLIRGAIVWAGLPDPLEERQQLCDLADDANDPDLLALVAAWSFPMPTTVKDALQASANDAAYLTLKSLVEGFDKGGSKADHLGKLLRRARGQGIAGRKFERTDHKARKWYLVDA